MGEVFLTKEVEKCKEMSLRKVMELIFEGKLHQLGGLKNYID